MYSLVLAAMLTAGPASAPAWGCHGCSSCHSCCGGCYGCHCSGGWGCTGCSGCCGGGCYGCCGGCYGCYGCTGCYGCYGGYGCYGCYGGCYGCCGGCYGCCGGCTGWPGCYGCYGYAAVAPVGVGYVAAAPTALPAATAVAPAADRATVVVQLPADARLWVDGRQADLTSATRSFQTPALEKDRDYFYTVQADATRDGVMRSQSARVLVRAGEVSRVDFGDLRGGARVTPDAAAAPAHVTVRLPENARLFVDDVPAPRTARGGFDTPRLDPGKTYYYTLRAETTRDGKTRSESRRVELQAGRQVEVDFTDLAAVASR